MGTVVNGKVWAGACVSGKVVSGLVKNGVVFYKKEIPTPSIYKRRIMVGDNLYQVKISSDYPENFYEVFPNNSIQEILINTSGGDMSFQTTVLNYSYGSLVISSFGDRLKDWYESSSENVTTYGNQETIFGNSIPVSERNNYNVTEIVNNENSNSYLAQAYRHLFIEDPNIRPVQVGDVITRNTKFYFTIPDDIFSRSNIGINPIRIGRDSSLSVLDNGNIIQFYINNIVSSDNEVVIFENGELVKNKSSMIVAETYGSYFEGTVTSVESDSLVYNMTFVDVRTLGA